MFRLPSSYFLGDIMRSSVSNICHGRVGYGRYIGVGASEFLGVQRIFAQNFPNLPKKLSCKFCRPFFGVASKKWSLLVILQTLGAIFEVKERWAPFLLRFSKILPRSLEIFSGFFPDFQIFCPNFQQIKTFGGTLAPPAPTSPTPVRRYISRFLEKQHTKICTLF